MANMTQEGVIERIFPTERKSDKFSAREFWLTFGEKYPETVQFQCTQERCDLLNSYAEGEKVTVSFDLRGRKWDPPQKGTMVFNTLNCWRIDRVNGAAQQLTTNTTVQPQVLPIAMFIPPNFADLPSEPQKVADTDDLPF
jgi:hypothetical protein